MTTSEVGEAVLALSEEEEEEESPVEDELDEFTLKMLTLIGITYIANSDRWWDLSHWA